MLTLVAVAGFSTVGALLHIALQRELLHLERQGLEGKVDVVQHFIDEVQSAADLGELRHHLDDTLIGNAGLRVWIVSADGQVLYGGSHVPPIRPADPGRLFITREDGVVLTGVRYALRTGAVLPDAHVLIGLDPRPREALMRTYDQATVLVCALCVAITVVLSIGVTRRGLRPLRRLSDEASSIAPDALSKRLAAHHASFELVPLVKSFNRVLDCVEDAYRQLEGFSADVAHELRTPLAILINGTEVSLSRERPAEELRDLLGAHLEDLRGLASMVNDMLFLAHADRGDRADKLAEVSLRDQALGVADFVEAMMEAGRHRLHVEGDVRVRADPSLVRRALINLVANAARYTPAGDAIMIRLEAQLGMARVSVINPGPPIPEDERIRMFDRFWRGESSRPKSSERHGLGLAIVRAVARMHGGETFAHSQGGVTTVGLTLGPIA
ncbi:HAMP domain-containing protein [Albitalea terrae]|uniref:Sensor protein n=2 Tax=Piscinibacter terrae TaxID=2496871 RepID=A0A3N7HIF1_9BURK|nr:HAMP domain-containing protein [Albitalea terrae]